MEGMFHEPAISFITLINICNDAPFLLLETNSIKHGVYF